MIDSREIKRTKFRDFYLETNFAWTQDINAPLETAKAIDQDLFAAVLIEGFDKEVSCDECEQRAKRERLANLMNSVAGAQGRRIDTSDIDWKKEAFKSGEISEDWTYRVKPKRVLAFYVFTGKDGRLIYEAQNAK